MYGKRPDGRQSLAMVLVHLPFLLYLRLVWRCVRLVKRENAFDVLLPDLVIGRRLIAADTLPEVEEVIDLTCEFPEPSVVRAVGRYVGFPILDALAPEPDRLLAFVETLDEEPRSRYVHCAEGHGRTGLVAAAILLRRGLADSPEDAVRRVRATRPLVRLNTTQRQCLEDIHRRLADAPYN